MDGVEAVVKTGVHPDPQLSVPFGFEKILVGDGVRSPFAAPEKKGNDDEQVGAFRSHGFPQMSFPGR
jgi:hypothetical protein